MIKGKNISLRPIELFDAELLQVLMNDNIISGNVVGWSFPVSLHNQQDWIKSLSSQDNYRLIIVDNQTGESIGIAGLWNIDWHNRSAESAIKILSKSTSKGIGTEVLMLIQAWSFYVIGLRRLYAEILSFNHASLNLYIKKCKWRVEGCQKEAIFRKGVWNSLYNVAILKDEFDLLPNAFEFVNIVCPINTTPSVNMIS